MARAARTTVVRRSPLVLVAVVIVVAALALLAATARPAALLARRGLDRVRELLQAEPDPALVGIHADHQQGQLGADAHALGGAGGRPAPARAAGRRWGGWDMGGMGGRRSTPGSSSTKAPKSVRRTILP